LRFVLDLERRGEQLASTGLVQAASKREERVVWLERALNFLGLFQLLFV
jgi:hypothetical protein